MRAIGTTDATGRAAGPPFDPDAMPETVRLSSSKDVLTLTWRDGTSAGLPSAGLRSRCRCAWCTRDRIEETFPATFPGVTISDIRPLGTYAVHLGFSDDHARGIFPWVYLRELARELGTAGERRAPNAEPEMRP